MNDKEMFRVGRESNVDFQAIVITRREKCRDKDIRIIPSNRENSIEIIRREETRVKDLSYNEISSPILKWNRTPDINCLYYEAMVKRDSEFKFPLPVDSIYYFRGTNPSVNRDYAKEFTRSLSIVRYKYPLAKIKVFNLNKHFTQRIAATPQCIYNNSWEIRKRTPCLLILMDILHSEFQSSIKNIYNELSKKLKSRFKSDIYSLDYCNRILNNGRDPFIRLIDSAGIEYLTYSLMGYHLTLSKVGKLEYERLTRRLGREYITYGTNGGDKKLGGYNHISLKTKRDIILGYSDYQFYNIIKYPLEVAYPFSCNSANGRFDEYRYKYKN